ncbi:DNA polymerase/3'-5' exonuclease PolX [Candidatus Oleimmundimicrobium sp.]|uniref:DNA polymerase/3'-5' exonuclease PolX n=1 Tax=Candidatus Oleimmundimicrobium sp. TaxID=3060597 RepID=UPI002715A8FD|nr:DNA polymerase/3'-5' exonuclease PolX [Candidatus Oleimmundimicrobium sp.]MDO8886119.1 DNA polymerase/3'-5' exonuclease PolX [Candidatus Oleimmundimicrobium sp.]
MDNQDVAHILDEIGEMLEIKGESSFKVRAYNRAAYAIRGLSEDINNIYHEGKLQTIPGIGKGIAERIAELLETGKLTYYEELCEHVPPGLLQLISIQSVGPKKAKLFYDKLGITTIEELLEAINKHKLRDLAGMGPKAEENIRLGILELQRLRERILLSEAYPLAENIVQQLKEHNFILEISTAGSLRRMKETIGDIDILAASNESSKAMDVFCNLPKVTHILAKGETKSSVVTQIGLQVDLRVVLPEQFGAALQYFTGSKEHNIHLRDIAKKKGLKVNEYGVFEVKTGEKVGGVTEKEVYNLLGMEWIHPTLRENKGEIEAALAGVLPNIVELSNIKGDIHVHSNWSDGFNKIKEIANDAKKKGYRYIAISDHAEKLKVAGGLTADDYRRQWKEIEKVNQEIDGLKVLRGAEVNIDNNGKVDFDDGFLKEFDIVTASIHSGFTQSNEQLTKRILSAIYNEHVNIIGHPTGRILGKRPPYPLDLKEIFKAAAETGTFLELNSFPDRLDLKDDYLREAKEMGVKFAINTDAHSIGQLRYMFYGVATAQRGWLEAEDVINTYPFEKLMKMLRNKGNG